MNQHYIVGIDEAGRGPLAGPVSIGAVICTQEIYKELKKALKEIKGKDSKKLKPEQRAFWFLQIKKWQKEKKLDVHVALISAHIIDKKGISFAIKVGIKKCLKKINAECDNCKVVLDGSLRAPEEFKDQLTIIKGDEKEPIIGLASIAAKVTRDKKMALYAKKYPQYLFEVHKGYGTLIHRNALKNHGLSLIHRKSFIKGAK